MFEFRDVQHKEIKHKRQHLNKVLQSISELVGEERLDNLIVEEDSFWKASLVSLTWHING